MTLTNNPAAASRIERGPLLDGVLPAGTMPGVAFRSDGVRFASPIPDAGVLEFSRGEVTSRGVAAFSYACRADLSNDSLVDDADFQRFIDGYEAGVCASAFCRADFNDDGLIDDADFTIFAAAYDILTCP
jgi:hypothetical protein